MHLSPYVIYHRNQAVGSQEAVEIQQEVHHQNQELVGRTLVVVLLSLRNLLVVHFRGNSAVSLPLRSLVLVLLAQHLVLVLLVC